MDHYGSFLALLRLKLSKEKEEKMIQDMQDQLFGTWRYGEPLMTARIEGEVPRRFGLQIREHSSASVKEVIETNARTVWTSLASFEFAVARTEHET